MALAAPVLRYLPKEIHGKQVLFQEAPDIYRVDLSFAFGDGTAGIVYRASRNMEDRDPIRAAIHGETIPGREDGGWIEVEIVDSARLERDTPTLEWTDLSSFARPMDGVPCWTRVSGCGSPECNGMYRPDGMMNGRPRYQSEHSLKTINYTSGWWLLAESYKGESWYAVHSRSATPPTAGWICGHRGLAPLPEVEEAEMRELKTREPETRDPEAPPIDGSPVSVSAHGAQAEDPYATARAWPPPDSAPVESRVGRASHLQTSRPEGEFDPELRLIANPTPREPGALCCCGIGRNR